MKSWGKLGGVISGERLWRMKKIGNERYGSWKSWLKVSWREHGIVKALTIKDLTKIPQGYVWLLRNTKQRKKMLKKSSFLCQKFIYF